MHGDEASLPNLTTEAGRAPKDGTSLAVGWGRETWNALVFGRDGIAGRVDEAAAARFDRVASGMERVATNVRADAFR